MTFCFFRVAPFLLLASADVVAAANAVAVDVAVDVDVGG